MRVVEAGKDGLALEVDDPRAVGAKPADFFRRADGGYLPVADGESFDQCEFVVDERDLAVDQNRIRGQAFRALSAGPEGEPEEDGKNISHGRG